MKEMTYAEYIWLDGAKPVQQLRSKTRVLAKNENPTLNSFPLWSFDGSSTNQASGDKSDCELRPVFFKKDPTQKGNHYLVLCEVNNADGTPHETNSRAKLREVMELGGNKADAYIGFEQEYTFYDGRSPLGWPINGYPAPQGPFYCGVGANNVFGREIVEEHTRACSEIDLAIYGINAEVMPGQWEFQIGYRGLQEDADPLTMSDHLWLGRYLLHKIAEKHGISVSFDNKPVKGDWNGAGMHTNFSTAEMRDPKKGMGVIEKAIASLSNNHDDHIKDYGFALEERLTGLHETCSINEFRYGVSDRGASVRIPLATSQKGYGYLEDRRPGANSDPYLVSYRLLSTICGISVDEHKIYPHLSRQKGNEAQPLA